MDNLETQEALCTRDGTWKNGHSRDTGNKNKFSSVYKIYITFMSFVIQYWFH